MNKYSNHHRYRHIASILLLCTVASSCATIGSDADAARNVRGWSNPLVNVWLPFAPKRIRQTYEHSILRTSRVRSDCQPNCPQVDVWQYAYQPDGNSPPIVDTKPISSRKQFWKASAEARIIAFSLFGTNAQYYTGLLDHLDSFKHIKHVNHIDDPIWGLETFTPRIYVAKRNPQLEHLGPLKNAVTDEFIEELLRRGCEVAYVDNGMPGVKKDGTFWRFLIAAEEMPEDQTIRYIVRDADWLLTAAEAYTVGEWIQSGLRFHRMHLIPVCFGPLTASWWGGMHQGRGEFGNLRTLMESYPYRFDYGDDEIFTRDIIWPRIKFSGSVLTHIFPPNWKTWLGNPYRGSCEQPTQVYCDAMKPGGKCIDVMGPTQIEYPYTKLGLRYSLRDFSALPHVFDLHLHTKRGQEVRKALSVENANLSLELK